MLRRFFQIITALLVLAIVGVGVIWVMRLSSPERNAAPFIEAGDKALAAGRRQEAADAYRNALKENENDRLTKLKLARLEPDNDSAGNLKMVQDVLADPQATSAELVEGAYLAIQLGEPKPAAEYITRLNKQDAKNPEILKIVGTFGTVAGRFEEARRVMEAAQQVLPNDPMVKLVLGQILARSESVVDRTRGKVLLEEVGMGPASNEKLSALIFLVASPSLPVSRDELRRYMDEFWNHPDHFSAQVTSNATILRSLVERFRLMGADRALAFAEKLIAHPEATDNDRQIYIFLAQSSGKGEDAGPLVEKLWKQSQDAGTPPDPRLLALYANYKLTSGQQDEAVALFRQFVDLYPKDTTVLPFLENALAEDDMKIGSDQKDAVIQMLVDHESTPLPTKLAAFAERIELFPLRKDTVLPEVEQRFADRDWFILGQWFLSRGDMDRVLALVTQDRATADLRGFELRFSALNSLKRQEEAIALFAQAQDNLPPFAREFYAARVAWWQANGDEARRHWERALGLARDVNLGDAMLRLARLAMENQANDLALQAYTEADGTQATFTEGDLIVYFQGLIDTKAVSKAAEIAAVLALRWPDNVAYANNSAYLNLLLNRDVDHSRQLITQAVERDANNASYRMTLALAHLRSGEPLRALRLVESTSIDLSNPASQAIYAAVLAANDRRPLASSVAATIDRGRLLKEEVQLIEGLSNSANN